jgi:2-methylcitrate dehydratase PrpD
VITTGEIVALTLGAGEADTDRAEAELALLGQAVTRGMDSEVVTVLRHIAPRSSGPRRRDPRPAGRPPAGPWPADPRWAAWLQGAAAAAGNAGPAWIPVCAAAKAVGALGTGSSPGSVARAVAAGYMVANRVADGLPGAADAGWYVPAVAGTIGAGAAAGSLLGLTADQLRHALGICAAQAAGLGAACGTDAGPIQIGKAAFNAVEAALLARSGFTSSRRSLEGRRGLYSVFSGQPVKS